MTKEKKEDVFQKNNFMARFAVKKAERPPLPFNVMADIEKMRI